MTSEIGSPNKPLPMAHGFAAASTPATTKISSQKEPAVQVAVTKPGHLSSPTIPDSSSRSSKHGATGSAGRVIALDLSPMVLVPGSTFILGDFRAPVTRYAIESSLNGPNTIDVVLSDMAHSFIGSGTTDHTLQMQLAWTALVFAIQNLRTGGNVAIKTRYGDEYRLFCLAVKSCFTKVSALSS